jgi:HAD superfamily hydrolase (TIGR01509 family)
MLSSRTKLSIWQAMTELQALIFDVDGTLAETERDGHRVAFNRAFAESGYDWNWNEQLYGELLEVAGGKERLRHYLNEYLPEFKPAGELDEFVVKIHDLKTHHYQQLLAQRVITLRPGVKRLISEARSQGFRLAIATTSTIPNVMALIDEQLEADWFEVIAAGDIVPAKKPSPDIYHYALEKMNLAPEECIAFEDSYQGLVAAQEAGLKTIVTVNDYTKHQNFAGAWLVVNHLGEPEHPFEVISGDVGDATYLDIDLLCRLWEKNL